MVRFITGLFVIIFILNIKVFSQNVNNIVAKVGNENISDREFRMRYELVPHFSRDQFNEDSSKQDLLYSIIAEKLLAIEANQLGYDTTDYFKYSLLQIENLYVRDALFKKYIASKVKISQAEIQKALDRSALTLEVKIISSGDSSTIFDYYNNLKSGASFDSLEKISDPVEYNSNKSALKITYGQMSDDYVEDTLYNLSIGSFSSPVKTEGGWFIFKLVGKKTVVPSNGNDPNFDKKVLDVLRLRKSRVIGLKYLESFYKNKKAEIDSTEFLSLVEKISEALTDKKEKLGLNPDGLLFLDEGSIMNILREFGNESNSILVQIKNNPISIKEYLFSLLVYPMYIKDPAFNSTARNLMFNLNKYIQYKFLSAEGYHEGLQNIPDVKEDINIWKDDYLAKMLKNTFRDSIHVTDEEVKNYYNTSKGIELINIDGIINDNLDIIEKVFNELRAKKDFHKLAEKYSQRYFSAGEKSESGYFPLSHFGEIGLYASKMKLNQIYGPIKTDSGYTIIKLIGRRYDSTKTAANFDSIKTQLKDDLLEKRYNQKFFKYIASLADKYKVSIIENNLKSIKVLDIPMFTYKFIGFGGRIAAMPFLGAWYDWVKYLPNKSVLAP